MAYVVMGLLVTEKFVAIRIVYPHGASTHGERTDGEWKHMRVIPLI